MMTPDVAELKRYLNVIKRAVSFLESRLDAIDTEGLLDQLIQSEELNSVMVDSSAVSAKPTVLPQVVKNTVLQMPTVSIASGPSPEEIGRMSEARKKHVQDLMAIDVWPEAVPPFYTSVASEQDQVNRANAVLDTMIDRSIEGASFLDFGCGEGWIAQEVLNRGVIESQGYDLVSNNNWSARTGASFTCDFNQIRKNHYDVVMLYDVLDHAIDPIALMNQVKQVMKKDGVVCVRCHPWTSRHATHLYKQGINKAYLHMFLSWDEISELISGKPHFTRQEKSPIEAYHWWFKDFEIKKERIIAPEDVSPFFHVPAFKELLAAEQQIPLSEIDNFLDIMKIQFVDFRLQLK